MSIPSLLVMLALPGSDPDVEVIGHVAWANAARGANRLATFYASLFDLPSRLVTPEWMSARFDAEYPLLASGVIAIDRPLGVVVVATTRDGIQRVEFGYSKTPATGTTSTSTGPDTLPAIELSATEPAIVAIVEPYVRSLVFLRDDRAVELSARVDLATVERRCLPAARAWATVATLLLEAEDPRRDWIERVDSWVNAWLREVSVLETSLSFESKALAISLDATPVSGSRFEHLLERSFAIEPATFSCSEPGLGLLGELGVDVELLVATWSDGGSARGATEDRSGGTTRVRLRSGSSGQAWILTAACRDDEATGVSATSTPSIATERIRSGDECGYAFGDSAMARAPLSPLVATRIATVFEAPLEPGEVVVGVFDFSLAAAIGNTHASRSLTERACRTRLIRDRKRVRIDLRLPAEELAAAIPRVRLDPN